MQGRRNSKLMGTEEALNDFMNANWEDILPRLTRFAQKWSKCRYKWRGPGDLPGGLTVKDIVIGAVQKTLEGLKGSNPGKGVRIWNPSNCPSLLDFLMGVVRSDLSSLAKSHDHQRTDRESKDLNLDELEGIHPQLKDTASSNRYEELMEQLNPRVKNDEEVEQLLIAYQELVSAGEEIGSKEVMELTGFTYPQFRNAKRRLQAIVESIFSNEKGGRRE